MSKKIRDKIDAILKTDADINAFCIDVFPEVYKRFSQSMQRPEKVNLLFELIGAEVVEKQLHVWADGKQLDLSHTIEVSHPRQSKFTSILVALIALLALATVSLLVLLLSHSSKPAIIFVQQSTIEEHMLSQGVKEEQFDSPEKFVEKIQIVGKDKVHYEVSIKLDRETKELMRLVLALLIQNDKFVAVTKYSRSQAKVLRNTDSHKANLLPILVNTIESATNSFLAPDLALITEADIAHSVLTTDVKAHPAEIITQPNSEYVTDPPPRNSGYIIDRLPQSRGQISTEQRYVIEKCARGLWGRRGDGVWVQCRDGDISVPYQSFYGEDVDRFKRCLKANSISKCGIDEVRVHWR